MIDQDRTVRRMNACDDPGSDHSPNRIAAMASVGLSPRPVSSATISRASSLSEAIEPAQDRGRSFPADPDRVGGIEAIGRQRRHLRHLSAVAVDHGEPIVGVQGEDRRPTRTHPVELEGWVRRAQSGKEEFRAGGLDRHDPYALLAGSLVSSCSACAISSSASCRLPLASSFFTSFSTERRL